MLRLRRNLQPRVSNHLAAASAVLLLVSSLLGMSDSMFAPDASSHLSSATRYDSMEPGRDALPTVQTATGRGLRISLMIFH